jgi:hypothetical protein
MRSVFSALFCLVSAAGSQLRSAPVITKASPAVSFIRSIDFKQTLRICNAYPEGVAMDAFLGSLQLTKEKMLPYKGCGEYDVDLSPGTKVDFRVGESTVGTFTVSDLPQSDATLLLVIHRRDAKSSAVSFESHVFPDSVQAQVAVVDTYRGKSVSEVLIQDASNVTARRQELLRFSTVVAVAPGDYEVILSGDGVQRSVTQFAAKMHNAYVVLRVGVDSLRGPSYPEELVIFPETQQAIAAHSGAARAGFLGALACLVLLQ